MRAGTPPRASAVSSGAGSPKASRITRASTRARPRGPTAEDANESESVGADGVKSTTTSPSASTTAQACQPTQSTARARSKRAGERESHADTSTEDHASMNPTQSRFAREAAMGMVADEDTSPQPGALLAVPSAPALLRLTPVPLLPAAPASACGPVPPFAPGFVPPLAQGAPPWPWNMPFPAAPAALAPTNAVADGTVPALGAPPAQQIVMPGGGSGAGSSAMSMRSMSSSSSIAGGGAHGGPSSWTAGGASGSGDLSLNLSSGYGQGYGYGQGFGDGRGSSASSTSTRASATSNNTLDSLGSAGSSMSTGNGGSFPFPITMLQQLQLPSANPASWGPGSLQSAQSRPALPWMALDQQSHGQAVRQAQQMQRRSVSSLDTAFAFSGSPAQSRMQRSQSHCQGQSHNQQAALSPTVPEPLAAPFDLAAAAGVLPAAVAVPITPPQPQPQLAAAFEPAPTAPWLPRGDAAAGAAVSKQEAGARDFFLLSENADLYHWPPMDRSWQVPLLQPQPQLQQQVPPPLQPPTLLPHAHAAIPSAQQAQAVHSSIQSVQQIRTATAGIASEVSPLQQPGPQLPPDPGPEAQQQLSGLFGPGVLPSVLAAPRGGSAFQYRADLAAMEPSPASQGSGRAESTSDLSSQDLTTQQHPPQEVSSLMQQGGSSVPMRRESSALTESGLVSQSMQHLGIRERSVLEDSPEDEEAIIAKRIRRAQLAQLDASQRLASVHARASKAARRASCSSVPLSLAAGLPPAPAPLTAATPSAPQVVAPVPVPGALTLAPRSSASPTAPDPQAQQKRRSGHMRSESDGTGMATGDKRGQRRWSLLLAPLDASPVSLPSTPTPPPVADPRADIRVKLPGSALGAPPFGAGAGAAVGGAPPSRPLTGTTLASAAAAEAGGGSESDAFQWELEGLARPASGIQQGGAAEAGGALDRIDTPLASGLPSDVWFE